MTASRHPRTSGRRPVTPPPTGPAGDPAASDQGDPLRWVWLALISGLFFVRWWQPTEGVVLGDTLGIAEGWLLALAMAGWVAIRGTNWRIQWDAWQWAVCLLAGGQILSGLIIVATSGDRRAALNLVWEWTALGVSFPLLRNALTTPAARRELIIVALGAILTLGSYGLTQRYIYYPRMVAQYEKLRNELDQLEQDVKDGLAANLPRMQKLRNELIASGLTANSLSGSGRALLEGRLKHSTEALGRFALANTFAGLLVVWWLLFLVLTWQQWRRFREVGADPGQRTARLLRLIVLCIATGLVGYCLLLTKSRTAIIAGVVGVGTYGMASAMASQTSSSTSLRQVVRWTIIAGLVLSGVTMIAGLTGGLDRFVLAEAPKSLQYRLEYWWSTLQVIRESPLMGAGPGQFRQSYLAHKLPRSSEEITDPHNLILDVWVNGGLISLIGLVWLTFRLTQTVFGTTWFTRKVFAFKQLLHAKNDETIPLAATVRESGTRPVPVQKIPQPKLPERTGNSESEVTAVNWQGWRSPFRWGAVGSLVSLWLITGGLESLLLILIVGWILSIEVLDNVLPAEPLTPGVWGAAGITLFVHLCGAGGIAMPAITQLWFVCCLLAAGQPASRASEYMRTWQKWSVLAAGLLLLSAGFVTAAQPAGYCRWLLEQGDFAQSPSTQERSYRLATQVDNLNDQPWMRLAELEFQKWRTTRAISDEDFVKAVAAQKQAIQRNPLSFQAHQSLAQFYAERAARTGDADDKINAVQEMQIALSRYPHNAVLLAEAANVFAIGGETTLAKSTAQQALEQDDINRAAGHRDKWLTEAQRLELQQTLRGGQ